MGTNTGVGIGIGIPFKNNALGGDRPYLPPELKARLIGVWDNYGKKNTDADRNIIKNKIPNAGGDLEILNAAYKLNSGFGKYKEDFTSWRIYPNIEVTDNVITTNGNFNLTWFIYKHSSESKINEMNIKVSGIPKGGKILYLYISDETANLPIAYTIPKDGIYHLPESKINNNRVSVGFTVESRYDWNNIRIEQIPSFEGAFVTDGIDDLITSTKTVQEMGITDEITVVSMIHKISSDNNWTNLIGELKEDHTFVANRATNTDKTGIYGYTYNYVGDAIVINNILGDKNDYIVRTSTSLGLDNKYYVTGFRSAGIIQNISQVAWYWTIIANKVLTTDQINQVIAYFNLDRCVEPTVLYDVKRQGLSNYTPDSDWYLKDFSKNGFDMSLFNFAKKGGSGVAAKQGESIKDYSIIKDEEYQELTIYNEFKFKIKSKLSGRYWTVQYINITNTSYPVTIVIDKDVYWVNSTTYYDADNNKQVIRKNIPIAANTPTNVLCCGYDQFDIPEDAMSIVSAVSYINYSAAGEITVEFIPSCKGGLITDGVNDYGKVTGLPIYKDYTIIADYERFYLEPITGGRASILSKSSKVGDGSFIFNLEDQNGGKACYTFGEANGNISDDITRIIRYQSKYYNTKTLSIGTAEDNDFMVLGKVREADSRYFYGAIYSLMSFPYSMSEFLIERQLKKHKLGTLYPDMVEFRPIVKSNNKWDIIEIWQGDKSLYRPTVNDDKTGIYLKKDSTIGIYVKPYVGQKVSEIVYNGVSYTDLKLNSNGFYYITVPVTKSPQKIGITIEQDENYILFNPVINSNVEYHKLDFYLNNYQKRINIGDYIPKDVYLRANFYLKNNVDELTVFTFNGVNIGYRRSSFDDKAFNIGQIYNYDSPQEVNITIDEYIRYEDIKQPYPAFYEFTDENRNLVTWGSKIKVGSTITRIKAFADSNLLKDLYNISYPKLNGVASAGSKYVVERQMVFTCTATYLLDDNEPKCILSPRLLRIPNSSYKILDYIPDISGHGNNGVINNSAYAEGSGVNEDGSYQFDGVDDFVTIPTTVGGKQVLMKVNWDSPNASILYDQRGYNNEFAIYNGTNDSDGNPIPAYQGRNNGQTYIDGILNSNIKASKLRAITHNITITNELSSGTNKTYPIIGSSKSNAYFVNMALYDFMLFDEISTDEEILTLNEYIGIEPKPKQGLLQPSITVNGSYVVLDTVEDTNDYLVNGTADCGIGFSEESASKQFSTGVTYDKNFSYSIIVIANNNKELISLSHNGVSADSIQSMDYSETTKLYICSTTNGMFAVGSAPQEIIIELSD